MNIIKTALILGVLVSANGFAATKISNGTINSESSWSVGTQGYSVTAGPIEHLPSVPTNDQNNDQNQVKKGDKK